MTFEEWWQQYVKPSHFYEVEQTAKAAWDYQQQRIDELLFLIQKKIEADIAAGRDWTDEQQRLWEVMADMTVPAWREIEEQE